MELNGTADAGRYIAGILANRGYTSIKPHLINKGRHIILEATDHRTGNLEVYYIMWKNVPFITYNAQFDNTEGEGLGESINVEYYSAIRRSMTLTGLLIAYPNGYVYNVPLKRLHMYADSHHRIRIQNNQEETTISFPISLADRWDEAWTSESLDKWINKPSLPEQVKVAFRKLKQRLFPETHDIKVEVKK